MGTTPLVMSPMTEANRSINEDLFLDIPETHTKNENNVSIPKKNEDQSSSIPRQPGDKSARRQLVLDIPGANNKARPTIPSLASPTLPPDLSKRRTQSR